MRMKIFETVRERLGWSKYKFAKELKITPSHYAYLSTKAKNAQTEIIVRLQELSGLTPDQFWKMLRKEYRE